MRGPIDRLTAALPAPLADTVIDWVITIVVAVGAVLAIKEWVVNPYRIPSSSMEPTLHCAEPADGCQARFSDRVLANRFIYHLAGPEARRHRRLRDAAGRAGALRRRRHVRETSDRAPGRGDLGAEGVRSTSTASR